MKHIVLSLSMLFVSLLALNANPVDPSLARTAASKFLEAKFDVDFRDAIPEMVYSGPNDAYFIFNSAKGFVIIAGDDAYRPVIGYSTESVFDPSNIPPALVDYLDGIAESVNRLKAQGHAVATPMVAAEWESVLNHGQLISRFGGREGEYFCQTQWNQDYPYNYYCPDDPDGPGGHAYVGCLATAMSQLMRFWAMPAQGMGSHCYVHENYGEICADFGATTYDWDNMPNVLTNNSSEEEMRAVGTLCFHCGVTIDMGYGPDGSGGASAPIPGVMHNYFDYSEANVQRSRNDYETETWKRMVREQFDMGWPMYYGGCQDGGCHAFVCDGYDDQDMFHFNLGWGGGSDGWYIIDEAPYTSPADAMFNFVPSSIYDITPSAPTDFSVVVPVETELRTLLHWTNPTTSLDGSPLSSIEEVVVMRNNQIVQVLSDLAPGETVDVEDADVPFYDLYHYAVYVKANGRYGKHAYALDVNVGPTCQWKVVMTTSNYHGWEGGYISIFNAAGHELTQCTMTSSTPDLARPVLPLGNLCFSWTAPENPVESMGFTIKDSEDHVVYSFNGSSEELESGVFLNINNTCGGELSCGTPENLLASPGEDHIVLTWDAVEDEGYGYNVYRDGLLCRLIPAGTTTSFLDEQATLGGHCYQVTVLCDGGDSGIMSNESCAAVGPFYPPRNLDYELTSSFRVKLMWEPPVPDDGLTGYALYRKKGDGEYKRVKLLNASVTTYTDNTLSQEDDYYYRLYAYYEESDCYSAPANRKYYPNVFELHAYYSPTELVESEEVEAEGKVTVYNLLGQQVASELEGLPAGVYVLRIENSHGISFKKIIHP